MPSKPPEAIESQTWIPGTGQDPAKYLVDPGHWSDGMKAMTPGDLAHARPWLDSGVRIFVWPIPTEGFRRTGQSTLGLHHYIGDQFVDAQVIHRDEARIEMNGVFPGLSGQDAMVSMTNTLNDDPPDAGMTLYVPGVFEQVKYVVPESWEFSHDPDDQTHSIAYTVTFVVIGDGRRVPDPSGSPPVNPDTDTFPGASVDLGPLDPWQIAIGISAQDQPGAPTYNPPDTGDGDGGAGAPSGPTTGGTGNTGSGSASGGYIWDQPGYVVQEHEFQGYYYPTATATVPLYGWIPAGWVYDGNHYYHPPGWTP
jgi:hypothetical protein